MIEELDLMMDSCVRTAKGGIVVMAKDRHNNRQYKINFSRDDFMWLVGKDT
jgi:hypothetical protein